VKFFEAGSEENKEERKTKVDKTTFKTDFKGSV
jgi:hypothetical protein